MTTTLIPLLTIAIPTYNRSRYLRQCLAALMPQVAEASGDVTVLVIDNASTDDTPHVLSEYRAMFPDNFRVMRNTENIGGDNNIAKCYGECATKYAWIFGDDDVLMPGAIGVLLPRMKRQDFGVIHIRAFPYKGDPVDYLPKRPAGRYQTFSKDSLEDMLYEVSDMFSFITGNIVNKSFVSPGMDIYRYVETRYNQIQWIFEALFSADDNLLVDDGLLAVNNEGNSGGYPFCRVFGTNYNLLFREFERRGVPAPYFDVINKRMARELFAGLIYFARKSNGTFRNYSPEDYFGELRPSYGKYWEFWLFIAPMCKLPKALLYPHFFAVRVINRIYRALR
ncbi:MAG TPA: glycosyltransferase family 2 protein [Ideonella sp.]|uniref:glycosyltransferase family 2 protein n=1 Tax=Ideonella sp. TaxID=1929293 RepID=UPI002CD07D83|nr:glycosyltransferase family 2 protein [Ideonella sp.]HSI48429.1 glycosyltransferase family 2 protein [Ideonella sp.]